MAHPVNAELVAVHWLRSLDLGPGVATSLPARDATPSWEATGFIQVTATGGAPHVYTGRQDSMLRLDSYAFSSGSRAVPFGRAATALAEVKQAVDGRNAHATVDTPASFLNARLMGAVTNADPQRVPDPGGMAHYTMLLQLWWVPIDQEE